MAGSWPTRQSRFWSWRSAVVIFLVNLAVAAKEVEQERETAPERVVLDELQLHPERAAEKKPSSPFED